MKLRSVAGILSLLLALTLAGAAPASAGEQCYPPSWNYAVRYNIETAYRGPVVTHAFNKVLAPGSTWSRTTTIERVNVVQASVEAYAEGTAGADTVIAKAEAKVGTSLKAAGSHTRKRSYSEQVSITNNTRANREYVVYSGTIKHWGKYRERWCGSDYQVHTKYGKWRSWTVRTSGTIRCDLAPPNRVAAKARRMYCG